MVGRRESVWLNSTMFRERPNKREATSMGMKVIPRHSKSRPPAESFTDLSQGMDFQTGGWLPIGGLCGHPTGWPILRAIPQRLSQEDLPLEGVPCLSALPGRRKSKGIWSTGRLVRITTSEEVAPFPPVRPRPNWDTGTLGLGKPQSRGGSGSSGDLGQCIST